MQTSRCMFAYMAIKLILIFNLIYQHVGSVRKMHWVLEVGCGLTCSTKTPFCLYHIYKNRNDPHYSFESKDLQMHKSKSLSTCLNTVCLLLSSILISLSPEDPTRPTAAVAVDLWASAAYCTRCPLRGSLSLSLWQTEKLMPLLCLAAL